MKCSKCGQLGHNARTCIRRQEEAFEEIAFTQALRRDSSIDKECPICLLGIHLDGDNTALPCCGNVLHLNCYKNYLKSTEKKFTDEFGETHTLHNETCFLCKTKVSDVDDHLASLLTENCSVEDDEKCPSQEDINKELQKNLDKSLSNYEEQSKQLETWHRNFELLSKNFNLLEEQNKTLEAQNKTLQDQVDRSLLMLKELDSYKEQVSQLKEIILR